MIKKSSLKVFLIAGAMALLMAFKGYLKDTIQFSQSESGTTEDK